MTAALGTNVTVECVADQPTLAWSVNFRQLLNPLALLERGETESVGDNYRSTLTISATELANRTIREIRCQAGQDEFSLSDGPPFTFTVYGQSSSPIVNTETTPIFEGGAGSGNARLPMSAIMPIPPMYMYNVLPLSTCVKVHM